MTKEPVSVLTSAGEEEIAEVMAKYNLLALPVCDEEGELHGIITIDDAIDLVLPLAWKKRLPGSSSRGLGTGHGGRGSRTQPRQRRHAPHRAQPASSSSWP